jgi:phage gp29-like protein
MAAERRTVYLPWSPGLTSTWTPSTVRSALSSHEQGNFAQSAKLWSAMGRDDRLSAVLSTRAEGLLGAPVKMAGYDETDEGAAKVALDIDADWPVIATRDQLRDLLYWRWGLGVGLAQLVPVRTASRWLYVLDTWDPQHLYYDEGARVWRLGTQQGQIDITGGDGQWVLWTAGNRGWQHGMVRSLAIPYLIREHAWRDQARYNERQGLPLVKLLTPAVADAGDRQEFWDDIRQMSTETYVECPQGIGPNGESYDVQLVEATARTWDAFQATLTACNVAYSVRVLGQNLTTEVQGGSYAAAEVSNDVRLDLKRADAEEVYEVARAQILPATVRANYGPDAPVPGPSYAVDPPDDDRQNAEVAGAVGDALTKLTAAGVPVDAVAFAEQFNVPLLPEGERDEWHAQQAAKVPPMFSAAGRAGFIEAQDYIDKVVAEGKARSAKAFAPDLAAIKAIIESSDSFAEAQSKLRQVYGSLDATDQARVLEKGLLLGQLAGAWAVQEDL